MWTLWSFNWDAQKLLQERAGWTNLAQQHGSRKPEYGLWTYVCTMGDDAMKCLWLQKELQCWIFIHSLIPVIASFRPHYCSPHPSLSLGWHFIRGRAALHNICWHILLMIFQVSIRRNGKYLHMNVCAREEVASEARPRIKIILS